MFNSTGDDSTVNIIDDDRIDKHPDTIKTGILVKRGQKYKTFKKRYFVLVSDKNDLDHPLGIIYLKSNAFLNKSAEISESVGYGFTLRSGAKRFLLAADSPEEKTAWLRAIDKVMTLSASKEKLAQQATARKRSVAVNGNSPTNQPENMFKLDSSENSGPKNMENSTVNSFEKEKIDRLQKQKDESLMILQQIDSNFVKLLSSISNLKRELESSTLETVEPNQETKEVTSTPSSRKKKATSSDDDFSDSGFDTSDSESENVKPTFDPTAILAPSTVADLMNPVERLKGLKSTMEKMYIELENITGKVKNVQQDQEDLIKQTETQIQEFEQENEDLRKRIQELETENEELGHHKKLLIKEVKKLRTETSQPQTQQQ
ncbi:predicted protein [Naegleria gruberi]|uniref:Predicted protein n=1 Tax=Naegleria gruberi TaxID=5762 RepID=D2VUX5_NAEGR|nr:uncharacterized protein NAEGRDRAFT_72819 [Naegleria gruberi]EFC39342.1 predicted protein [Naegleria gruberi]|eukprot:XP_002672086.1 predicted protein [Naegleria gruberi strain NEG-M]